MTTPIVAPSNLFILRPSSRLGSMALDCIEEEDSESVTYTTAEWRNCKYFHSQLLAGGSSFWAWLLVKMARSFWPVAVNQWNVTFCLLSSAKFLSPHLVQDAHTCPPAHVEPTACQWWGHPHLFTDVHAQRQTTWAKSTGGESHDEALRRA